VPLLVKYLGPPSRFARTLLPTDCVQESPTYNRSLWNHDQTTRFFCEMTKSLCEKWFRKNKIGGKVRRCLRIGAISGEPSLLYAVGHLFSWHGVLLIGKLHARREVGGYHQWSATLRISADAMGDESHVNIHSCGRFKFNDLGVLTVY